MNKKELKQLLIIFLLSRVLIIFFLILNGNLSILNFFDQEHYNHIAQYGYDQKFLYAFFPLYPMLIRILHVVIPSYKLSGFIISNVCSFLSLMLLSKMLSKNKDKKYYLICLAFTPILAFMSMDFTESLFMLLTLLGFYLYKKDKYLLSALVVGLSILTRNSGIILWGAIGIDMLYKLFKKKDIKLSNIALFGIVSLLIGMIYPVFLYVREGDFLLFAHIQEIEWGRENTNLVMLLINDLKYIKNNFDIGQIVIALENWISYFALIILGIKLFKKDKVSSIYILVSLFAFQLTCRRLDIWKTLPSISLFRYVLCLFPIYLYMFDIKSKNLKYILIIGFISFALLNAVILYSGGFIG